MTNESEIEYMHRKPQKTAKPILAGVFLLLWIFGLLLIALLLALTIIGLLCWPIIGIQILFSLIGAVFCFERKHYDFALISSLISINILSLILIVLSKEEFRD